MSLAVERHGKAMNAGWLRRSLQREREMFGRRYQGTIETRCQYVLAQVARRFTTWADRRFLSQMSSTLNR